MTPPGTGQGVYVPRSAPCPHATAHRVLAATAEVESPEHQRRAIEEYFVAESPEGTVVYHSEKVASERVYGEKHDVWDVHSSEGRWWVITNPTNLYPHDDSQVTPSMDRALAIHIGLMARVMARQSKQAPVDEDERQVASQAWRKYEQAADALDNADEAEDFQAVGMRLREALIVFAQEVGTPEMVPDGEPEPQKANFKAWAALIARHVAPGGHNEQMRSYLRKVSDEAWDLVAWLTHATNATRFDGIIAMDVTGHLLNLYSIAKLRHERGVPDRCPTCGSYQLVVDFRGFEDDDVQRPIEVNLCEACSWEEPTRRSGGTSGAA
jgi:hypothetical protein